MADLVADVYLAFGDKEGKTVGLIMGATTCG
jgi:hypothetical protein